MYLRVQQHVAVWYGTVPCGYDAVPLAHHQLRGTEVHTSTAKAVPLVPSGTVIFVVLRYIADSTRSATKAPTAATAALLW